MFRRVHPAPILKKKLAASWRFEAAGPLKHISAALAVSAGESWDRGTGSKKKAAGRPAASFSVSWFASADHGVKGSVLESLALYVSPKSRS